MNNEQPTKPIRGIMGNLLSNIKNEKEGKNENNQNNQNNQNNENKVKIEEKSDMKIIMGNLSKNINTEKFLEKIIAPALNKISRFKNDKIDKKALSEIETRQIENKEILDRFLNDIFTTTTPKIITSVNRHSIDVTNDQTKEEVLKTLNDPKTTKDEKNDLYFKLKARKEFIFNIKYKIFLVFFSYKIIKLFISFRKI